LVWHFGGPEQGPQKAMREYVFGRTISTCAVHDGLVYAADIAGYIHCLSARTGRLHWRADLRASVWGSPLWGGGKGYIATEDEDWFVSAHAPTEKLLAQVECELPIRTTPVAAHGVVYILTEPQLLAIVAP